MRYNISYLKVIMFFTSNFGRRDYDSQTPLVAPLISMFTFKAILCILANAIVRIKSFDIVEKDR